MENETPELTERKYHLAILCEVCGEPVKLIRTTGDGWLGACSAPDCETIHQGSF